MLRVSAESAALIRQGRLLSLKLKELDISVYDLKSFYLLIHFYFSKDCCGLTPRNNIKQCMRILLNRIHTAIEATSTLKCSIDISKEVGFIPTLNFDFCIHFKSRVYLTCTLHHTFSLSLTYNKGPIGR